MEIYHYSAIYCHPWVIWRARNAYWAVSGNQIDSSAKIDLSRIIVFSAQVACCSIRLYDIENYYIHVFTLPISPLAFWDERAGFIHVRKMSVYLNKPALTHFGQLMDIFINFGTPVDILAPGCGFGIIFTLIMPASRIQVYFTTIWGTTSICMNQLTDAFWASMPSDILCTQYLLAMLTINIQWQQNSQKILMAQLVSISQIV